MSLHKIHKFFITSNSYLCHNTFVEKIRSIAESYDHCRITATMINFFAPFFLLMSFTIAANGYTCNPDDFSFEQTIASYTDEPGKVVLEASIFNKNPKCSYSNVQLSCQGFHTDLTPDPTRLQINPRDGRCLVNEGKPLPPNLQESIFWHYTWRGPPTYNFKVIECTPMCPKT